MARLSLPTLLLSVGSSLAVLLLPSCKKVDSDLTSSTGLKVIVSVPPQADFVQRVGGAHVQVDVLVGPGQDPHSFSPTPAQMALLSQAEVYLTVGMPFEEALQEQIETANSNLKVVSMSDGFEKLPSECDHPSHDAEDAHGHGDEHGHEGEHAEEVEHGHGDEHAHEDEHGHHHEHGEDDPHVWLSPIYIKVQADNIAGALKEALPEHAAEFEQNLAAFHSELDALHSEIDQMLEPKMGEEFFVFHPAFGYFGHTYGIDQVAVEVNGNEPTPNELAAFIDQAKKQGMKTLFVQPQFDDRSAKTIADQLGARVESLDPLDPDVLANIRRIAQAIAGTS